MLPISYLNLANVPAFRSVQVLEGLVARQDRAPPAERVDPPGIQERFCISFSSDTRLTESMATRNALASQAQDPTTLYRRVAAL